MTDNKIDKAMDKAIDKAIERCKNTNDPITRKMEEIDRLEKELNRKAEHIQQEIINRQKAEIDRLKNELHGKVEYIHEQREIIDEKKAEIERLKAENEGYKHLDTILHTAIDKLTANIKSEAIREFAEKLKNVALPIRIGENEYEVVTKQAIDHFVKEMTEGGNG